MRVHPNCMRSSCVGTVQKGLSHKYQDMEMRMIDHVPESVRNLLNEAALLRVREKSDTSRPKSGGGRMKKGDRVPLDITPLGYEWMLKNARTQLWLLMVIYLQNYEEDSDSDHSETDSGGEFELDEEGMQNLKEPLMMLKRNSLMRERNLDWLDHISKCFDNPAAFECGAASCIYNCKFTVKLFEGLPPLAQQYVLRLLQNYASRPQTWTVGSNGDAKRMKDRALKCLEKCTY